MSAWQAGDLAVCVDDSPCRCCGVPVPVRAGQTFEVVDAFEGKNRVFGTGLYLALLNVCPMISENHRTAKGFRADRFRKILPDKHEECEPEFVTLLKRIKIGVAA